jgi:hypothetical protein
MSTQTSPGVAVQSAAVWQIDVQVRSQVGQRAEAHVAPLVHAAPSAAPPAIGLWQNAFGLPATSWTSVHTSPAGQLDGAVHGTTTQTSKVPFSPPTVTVCDWHEPDAEQSAAEVQAAEQ